MINLTTKERLLLEDEKSHEQLCVSKYKDYATKASDQELKNLFNQIAQHEQQHLDSINQLLNGVVPNVSQQQGQGSQQGSQQNQQQSNMQNLSSTVMPKLQMNQSSSYNENDKMLCQDCLSTEKYISSTYNTTIFEVKDTNARQVLNHIQKEEQEHGYQIFNYMNKHGMYNQ